MARKNKTNIFESYVLPSTDEELKTFVNVHKIDMMERVLYSIEYAIQNKLPIVELFQFKNSKFVITISEQEFEQNLDNIYKYYMENEIYELCPRAIQLQKLVKRNTNEK